MKNKNPFSCMPLSFKDKVEFANDKTIKYFKYIKEDIECRRRFWYYYFVVGRVYEAKNQLVGDVFNGYKGYYVKTSSKDIPWLLINGRDLQGYFTEIKEIEKGEKK